MTRRLLVAVAIVCVTNVGAVVFAALNRGRASEPMTLTERELRLDSRDTESTAVSLHLAIARPARDAWLDRAKLESLGYDCSVSPDAPEASRWYERQLPRDVLIVLEFDGPAWARHRAAIERGEEDARHRAAPVGEPITPTQSARVIAGHTRLFAVDAGTDAGALRARYPDAARYLITHGAVTAQLAVLGDNGHAARQVRGYVLEVSPQDISVPRDVARVLVPLREAGSSYYGEWLEREPRYAVTLRYGRFLEPWVTAVVPRPSM